jgi:hypothetical protein
MLRVVVLAVVVLVVLVGAATGLGARRWQAMTDAQRMRLAFSRLSPAPARVDFRELHGLPAPVQRCFRAVLQGGQPMIAGAHLRHRSTSTFAMHQTDGSRSRRISS